VERFATTEGGGEKVIYSYAGARVLSITEGGKGGIHASTAAIDHLIVIENRNRSIRSDVRDNFDPEDRIFFGIYGLREVRRAETGGRREIY